MKSVILEYAGAGISTLGAIVFLDLLGKMFLGKEGILVVMISMVLGGL